MINFYLFIFLSFFSFLYIKSNDNESLKLRLLAAGIKKNYKFIVPSVKCQKLYYSCVHSSFGMSSEIGFIVRGSRSFLNNIPPLLAFSFPRGKGITLPPNKELVMIQ